MGNINNALSAMQTIFQAIDPSPEDALTNVWVWPADRDSIVFTSLPVGIISWDIVQPGAWLRNTMDSGRHDWNIEGLIFLKPGPITKDEQAELAEEMCEPWLEAIAAQFSTPDLQRLYGNVDLIGTTAGNIFNYQIGEIHWWGSSNVFWGIRTLFRVSQSLYY